jgi:hypothetical protein
MDHDLDKDRRLAQQSVERILQDPERLLCPAVISICRMPDNEGRDKEFVLIACGRQADVVEGAKRLPPIQELVAMPRETFDAIVRTITEQTEQAALMPRGTLRVVN